MKTDNKNNIPPQAMSIAAFSMCEPEEPIMPFVPSWHNVWESHMLNLANKRTGSCHWAFRRYGVNHKIYPNEGIRNASYRPYLHSMERSCDYAVSKLNIRNKLSLRKGNNGFIYVESWGEISTFEDISSWRDSFNINIVPKSILKKYGIKGFSCKVRGERNGLMSALLLAQDLLSCNEFDNIFNLRNQNDVSKEIQYQLRLNNGSNVLRFPAIAGRSYSFDKNATQVCFLPIFDIDAGSSPQAGNYKDVLNFNIIVKP